MLFRKSIVSILTCSIVITIAWHSYEYYTDYRHDLIKWQRLVKKVEGRAKNFKGRACIVIKDYNRNFFFSQNADMKVPSASVVKMPLAAAVFTADTEGIISVKDTLKLKKKDITGGSGSLKNQRPNKEFSIEELVNLTITISDNTAANMLINLLGFDYINNWFMLNGMPGTNLSRHMMDMASRSKGIENYTTANDISAMLDSAYRNKLVNQYVSSECISLLKKQKTRNRIPAKLPKDTVVAHKTGLERGVCHDAGIVYTKNGNFLISVLTKHNNPSSQKSRELISDIALYVYRYYVSE
jgi:beta-lactamase class A